MKTYKILAISAVILTVAAGAVLLLRAGGTQEEREETETVETETVEAETTETTKTESLVAVEDVQPDSQFFDDQAETTESDAQEVDEEMLPQGIDHLEINWGEDEYIRNGEIVLDEVTYRAQEDGIYLVSGEEQNCIWEGYIHLEFPWEGNVLENFRYENGDRVLLWIADADYEAGGAEWKPDSVAWLNTNSKQSGMIKVSEFPFAKDMGELWIGNISISSGFLSIGNYTAEGNREWFTCLLPLSAPGYQGEEPERMGAEEREEYGRLVSEYLRSHPGEVMDVSVRDVNGTKAWLDLDGNGSVEEIELWPGNAYCRGHYVDLLAGASLRMGGGIDVVGYQYGANLTNYLYAVSLDGREILVMLYEEGPSDDPLSTFMRYENGMPAEIGAIGSFVGSGSIAGNGDIHVGERRDIIESGYLEFTYRLNAEYRLERVEEETHKVLRTYWEGNPLVLLTELPIHETPGGAITGHLEPGEVKYTWACLGEEGESDWIYMEGDKAAGWVEVSPHGYIVDLGDDVDSRDVFGGLEIFG